MSQIKHIARFTSPGRFPETKASKTSRALALAHAARKKQGQALVQAVTNILLDSSQPLTADEVAHQIQNVTGHAYHFTYIRQILNTLVETKVAVMRSETHEERCIRAGGEANQRSAALFFAGSDVVPARTEREAVEGFLFKDRARGYKYRETDYDEVELVDVSNSVAPVSLNQNAVIDTLIEMLVKQKTAELQEELAVTKKELSELRARVKSLLG